MTASRRSPSAPTTASAAGWVCGWQGETTINGMVLQPYLKANIWHDFGGTDTVRFDTTDISTEGRSTSFEFGGGVVAKVTDKVSIFATGDYTTNLGGDKRRILEGNLGFSVKW